MPFLSHLFLVFQLSIQRDQLLYRALHRCRVNTGSLTDSCRKVYPRPAVSCPRRLTRRLGTTHGAFLLDAHRRHVHGIDRRHSILSSAVLRKLGLLEQHRLAAGLARLCRGASSLHSTRVSTKSFYVKSE